jgi:hypothetical protein
VDDERRYGHHCLRCGYERYNSKGNGPEKVSNKDWEDISQDSFFILAILEIMLEKQKKTSIFWVEKIAAGNILN